MFCGLLAAYWGLINPLARTSSFVVAGVSFGLALGSRGSMIIVAPILVVVTALAANRSAGYPRTAVLRSLGTLGLPVAAAVAMLLIHNNLRFDSFTEFIGLCVHTIVTGLCLGFTGHMDTFSHENPVLFDKLKAQLSFCRS